MTKTEIRFAAGIDGHFQIPQPAKAGLDHRFAVIQETYRADSPDSYFDEPLWLRLIEFARESGAATTIRAEGPDGRPDVPLDDFLSGFRDTPAADREPAEFVSVWRGPELILFIHTEFWCRLGGPPLYHDSYTYSLYTKDDVSERVMRFVAQADAASGWDLAKTITQVEPTRPRVFQRTIRGVKRLLGL